MLILLFFGFIISFKFADGVIYPIRLLCSMWISVYLMLMYTSPLYLSSLSLTLLFSLSLSLSVYPLSPLCIYFRSFLCNNCHFTLLQCLSGRCVVFSLLFPLLEVFFSFTLIYLLFLCFYFFPFFYNFSESVYIFFYLFYFQVSPSL